LPLRVSILVDSAEHVEEGDTKRASRPMAPPFADGGVERVADPITLYRAAFGRHPLPCPDPRST
jgi:hypothetical protein